jgi:hypothetical protein
MHLVKGDQIVGFMFSVNLSNYFDLNQHFLVASVAEGS